MIFGVSGRVTVAAIAGYPVIGQQGLIPARQVGLYFIGEALDLLTYKATEMDMIVLVILVLGVAIPAKGIIEFSFVGNDLVDDAVLAETVQHPVDGHAIHAVADLFFEQVLAECGRGCFENLQDELFCCSVAPVHERFSIIAKILQLCRMASWQAFIDSPYHATVLLYPSAAGMRSMDGRCRRFLAGCVMPQIAHSIEGLRYVAGLLFIATRLCDYRQEKKPKIKKSLVHTNFFVL